MTVEDALGFFIPISVVARKLQTLMDMGLSYVRLGQNATTLSGGEAQRVKLAKELSKRATGRTLYILDEPTTGPHFHAIAHLLEVLHRLGPEGGDGGGEVIATSTPEDVAANERSYTGAYLKPALLRAEQRKTKRRA